MRAWRSGKVAIANAPGSGVADDKVIYAFVPDMIRYYLNEKPLLDNVPTYLCMRERDREHVLKNIAKLVVKPANESGGYGIMVGPHSSAAQHRKFARLIEKDPRNYIAQPTLSLSTAPYLFRRKGPTPTLGSQALHSSEQKYLGDSWRTDARCAQKGFTGGQFLSGRW